jgi:hypothetical protein
MKVLDDGRFSISVYREIGQPHHLPHCHVQWADGKTVVALPLLQVIVGDPLPPAARQLLLDELEKVCAAWNKINIERTI